MPEAAPGVPDRAALREALAYLLDEVAMLRAPLARLPEVLHVEAPISGAPSLRESYALLAARDEARTAALAGTITWPEAGPHAAVRAEGANACATDDLLDRVVAAREALLSALDALPEDHWPDVALRLHRAVLDDAALLRAVAEHLHDARGLTGG